MIAWPRPLRSCATGTLLLALAACGGDGGADPSDVVEVTLDVETVELDATGQTRQLTATARDADGEPVEGVDVDWASGDPEIVTVDETGLLVAQDPGTADVTATVGGVSASATVVVNSVAALSIFEGNGQQANAGQTVPTPPAVRVIDASENPVAGVRVRFQVGSASGSITGETQTTDASGVARVDSWRLGSGGLNTLDATVEGAEVVGEPLEFIATTADPSGYNITMRYLNEDMSTSQLQAFAEAELRWESIITGDLADVNQDLPANFCSNINNPATPGPFDDVTIFVEVVAIDGEGGVLGQAGPCAVRVVNDVVGLTVIGQMQFDLDDIEALEGEDLLPPVILHEMGHVLGFGTLWEDLDLLADPADPDTPAIEDPHFTGAAALAAFEEAGGTLYTGEKVPVMDVGGTGTINSHWRDQVFDPEVMTGFLNAGFNPLSAITVRSLEDMGYVVSVEGADPFTLDLVPFRAPGPRRGRHMINDITSGPIHGFTPDGRVVPVRR